MASRIIDANILTRNDPAATWTSVNPVLAKGEMGLENDTNKFKFGNGVDHWNDLDYASTPAIVKTADPGPADTDYETGSLWINATNGSLFFYTGSAWKSILTKDQFDNLFDPDGDGVVDKAEKLASDYDLTVSGDVNISINLPLSSLDSDTPSTLKGTATATLPNISGLTAGQYTKLNVNAKGQVIGGDNLTASDIPDITLSKVTDAGTAASKDVGTASGNVPVLGSDGKLDTAVLPALAITDSYEVASEAAMLALNAQKGDIAIRSDINKTFVLKDTPASTKANWVELKTPTDAVLSVNGQTGAVTLTTSNISEGTNLYYTDARATSNFNTNVAKTNVSALKDGRDVLMVTDTFVIDCGGASRA